VILFQQGDRVRVGQKRTAPTGVPRSRRRIAPHPRRTAFAAPRRTALRALADRRQRRRLPWSGHRRRQS